MSASTEVANIGIGVCSSISLAAFDVTVGQHARDPDEVRDGTSDRKSDFHKYEMTGKKNLDSGVCHGANFVFRRCASFGMQVHE